MDTTIILVLVLSAFFLGSILWLVIYTRRVQGTALPERREARPAAKKVRGRASGGEKTR